MYCWKKGIGKLQILTKNDVNLSTTKPMNHFLIKLELIYNTHHYSCLYITEFRILQKYSRLKSLSP